MYEKIKHIMRNCKLKNLIKEIKNLIKMSQKTIDAFTLLKLVQYITFSHFCSSNNVIALLFLKANIYSKYCCLFL